MLGIVVIRLADHDDTFTDDDGVTEWEDEDGNTTFTDDNGLVGG